MRSFALLALASAVAAQYRGFNYGATMNDGTVRAQQDFTNEFNRAKSLQGQSGFTSARLYTMIQGGTADTVTSAIPAAIDTRTTLLLGLWASAGQAAFNSELTALRNAINQYGTQFTDLIAGISVGSEDLYRISPTGIENNSGVGVGPSELVSYIGQVRDTIQGTAASAARIGHVDTWNDWVNGSNAAVINAVDWLGMDGYPYYQTTQANGIQNAESLFFESYNATVNVARGKEVWVTETGWPAQGPTAGQAVASLQNAETYWQEVACRLLGNVNTWWYTLQDPQVSTSSLSFGVVGNDLNSAPLYNLACSNSDSQPSSPAAVPSSASASSSSVSVATTPSVVSAPVSSAAYPTGGASQPSTLVTVTSCASSVTLPPAQSSQSGPSATPSSPSTGIGKNCPTNLSGQYEFPHLIVPVDSSNPTTAYGTSYDGTINSTVSSIFNFDLPASVAGKTCSLIFLFPEQKDLQTSSYTFNNQGGIQVTELQGPATEQTTYQNKPAVAAPIGTISSIAPGNEYLIGSHECGAGVRIGFEFSSTGGLDLSYFQDYNPSPIGAYISVC